MISLLQFLVFQLGIGLMLIFITLNNKNKESSYTIIREYSIKKSEKVKNKKND